MNTKQILLLIVLVVIIGIGGLLMHRNQGESWQGGIASGEKLLANLPVGETLAQVILQQGTNTVTLEKKNEAWSVKERGGYPASFGDISGVILKLRELKPVQTEAIGASQMGRLELLPPGPGSNTATRVEFRDASGKSLAVLLLGKTQMREDARAAQFGGSMPGGYPAGRWVMLGGVNDRVSLVPDPLTSLEPNAGQWLNKDFFKVDKIRAITVSHGEATNSWSISRTNEFGGEWMLADANPGESLDPGKTGGLDSALSSPAFNDVVPDAKPGALGLDKPVTVVIQTFDGFTYTLKVGAKQDDSRALTLSVAADLPKQRTPGADEKAEDKARLDKEFTDRARALADKFATEKSFEKWTYIVPGWTLDAVLKSRGEMLAEKKSEEPKPDVNTGGEPSPLPVK